SEQTERARPVEWSCQKSRRRSDDLRSAPVRHQSPSEKCLSWHLIPELRIADRKQLLPRHYDGHFGQETPDLRYELIQRQPAARQSAAAGKPSALSSPALQTSWADRGRYHADRR